MEKLIARIRPFEPYFKWLRWFYPQAKGIPFYFLMYYFFPQKILRVNGSVPWPVHFTSRVMYRKNIVVGNKTAPGMSSCCYIQGRYGIHLGHNVLIAPGVGLISANHSMHDFERWDRVGPIIVGDNVWIGMNSVVLPGVKIGSNVIIGANSVVSHDIASDTIAAGNPCRRIKEKPPYTGTDYTVMK